MLAKVTSVALVGLDAHLIDVEVDIGGGLPQFSVVGLPDATVRESRDRVRAALKNSGFTFPVKKITVNLAPADVRKEGAGLDLAIAVGILIAEEQLSPESARGRVLIGELSFDGQVRPVPGALSFATACRKPLSLVLPFESAREAATVRGVQAFPVHTLPEAVEFLNGARAIDAATADGAWATAPEGEEDDFAEVHGQAHAKRALEIAAAGGHNVLMVGPPGSGKTMLARRLPGILPPMTPDEALETARIHSIAGLLPPGAPLPLSRPFRAPHHSVSDAGLIGGGAVPRPGEVSLAHHGVLFLDEAAEFNRHVLNGLRQPLEDGAVVLTRVSATLRYPARVMLVAAMNPCPCGSYGNRANDCLCTPNQIRTYRTRIPAPLLDRLDLHVEVPAVPVSELGISVPAESSAVIRARVVAARRRQLERDARERVYCNAALKPRHLKKYCALDEPGRRLLERAMTQFGLSARAYGRILRVARTIADLAGSDTIRTPHLAEAIQYRSLDRRAER